MPYTQRQLYGLATLGITPWVLRSVQPPVETVTNQLSQPDSLNSLGDWLLDQPLEVFTYRGSTLDRIGQEDADVVIVFNNSALPLAESQARLLTEMLRAIDLDPRSTLMVTVADQRQSDSAILSDVCSIKTRAILYFADEFVSADTTSDHAFKARDTRAWCMPSLASMQKTPQLKRLAWNSLKALRTVRSGH